MRRGWHAEAALTALLVSAVFVCSSCVHIEVGHMTARYEREVPLAAALESGRSLAADLDSGSLTVQGTETSECKGTARIIVHARTEERAQTLGEEIDVGLEPFEKGVRAVIKKPLVLKDAYYSISLNLTVPVQTSLALATRDGNVRVANIVGDVDARSSDGGVEAESVKGDVKLRTSDGNITGTRLETKTLEARTSDGTITLTAAAANMCNVETRDGGITLTNVRAGTVTAYTNDGAIKCRDLSATRAHCRTFDGPVQYECALEAPPAPFIRLETGDGNILFAGPPGLSAVIEANTDDGSISSELPITARGRLGKSLKGTVGAGEGKVFLTTHDGSITIR
jgi:hypothetical protein